MDFEEKRAQVWKARQQKTPGFQTGQIAQAAIAASHVTGTPEWDRLLTIIQADAEKAKGLKASLEVSLMGPDVTDPQEMTRLKTSILVLTERIRTIEEVIALPARLMRESQETGSE